MWQNAILMLARNPAALRALIDLIAPAIRQENAPAVAALREEVQALAARQTEVEAQLRAELAQTRQELARAVESQEALQRELAETNAQLAMVLRAFRDLPAPTQVVVERDRPWWRR